MSCVPLNSSFSLPNIFFVEENNEIQEVSIMDRKQKTNEVLGCVSFFYCCCNELP